MIPLLSREHVRELDRDAVARLGVPSLSLMENAGHGAFDVIQAVASGSLERVLVVGGPGQNGGDGWVVARHLRCAGRTPHAALIGSPERVRGDALINWQTLEPLGVERSSALESLAALDEQLRSATLVVDALFGTGLDRPLTGIWLEVVRRMAGCGRPVVALDLPSGVDADTGAVLGSAVRADHTVTFAAHKRGLDQHPGCGLAGRVHLVSIGVPGPHDAEFGRIEASDVATLMKPRAVDAHKGSGGHVLVVGGSPGRTGAAVLSGLGALRAGAGLCTLAPRGDARVAIEAKALELMTAALPATGDAALSAALELADSRQAAVVGPGLGLDADGRELARGLALRLPVPAVLDADALTSIGQELASLAEAKAARVLTPHPGEAARLLGLSSAEVQADRYAAAARLARASGCVTVLKGARSIVADPSGRVRVCPTGTPAMGVGGTGDVLSGVIGALLASLAPFEAAVAGTYLHGLAGELAAVGDRGLFASELATALPRALLRCRQDASTLT